METIHCRSDAGRKLVYTFGTSLFTLLISIREKQGNDSSNDSRL